MPPAIWIQLEFVTNWSDALCSVVPAPPPRTHTMAPLLLRPAMLLTHAAPLARTCSCKPRAKPPCPPCASPPRPACRAPPITSRLVARAACPPPSAGARPPCEPDQPACAATCATNRTLQNDRGNVLREVCGEEIEQSSAECGSSRDRVAARHAAAERARRREYEREVSERERAAPVLLAEPRYRLGGERLAARDADGREYGAPCGAAVRCELAPPDTCRRRPPAALDPCAHRAELRLDVERACPATAAAAGNQAAAPAPPARPAAPPCDRQCAERAPAREPAGRPAKGLTTRIMESLSLSRGKRDTAGATCPRAACGPPELRVASRAGTTAAWCARPPALGTPPAACKPLSLAERLRARQDAPGAPRPRRRELHTSAGLQGGGKARERVAAAAAAAEDARLRVVLEEAHARPGGERLLRLSVSAPSVPGVRLELKLDETAPPSPRGGRERAKSGGSTASPATKSDADMKQCPHGPGSAKASSWLSNFHRKLAAPAPAAGARDFAPANTPAAPSRVCPPPPPPMCGAPYPRPPTPAAPLKTKSTVAKCPPTVTPPPKSTRCAGFTPHAIFIKSN